MTSWSREFLFSYLQLLRAQTARHMQLISTLLGLVIGLLSFLLIGEALLRTLRLEQAGLWRTERLVVSFGLGNGAIILEMFFFSMGNVPLTRQALALPWLLMGGGLLYGRWQRRRPLSWGRLRGSLSALGTLRPGSQKGLRVWWGPFFVLAIALAVTVLFVTTLRTPFLYGDDIAFWTPKAKIFYRYRSTPWAAFSDLPEFFHPDYPLLVPFTEVWLFLWMGQVNEYLMKFLFPVYTMLLVLGVWAFVYRFSGPQAALVAAGLLATTPFVLIQGTTGYADLPLAFYYWLATALLLGWFHTSRVALLVLGAIFLGFTGWTKNEGLPLMLFNGGALVAYLVARRRSDCREMLRAVLMFGGIAVSIVLPWLVARYNFRFESDLPVPPLSNLLPLMLQRSWPIGKALAKELFGAECVLTKWNLAWYLLVLGVVLHRRALWSSLLRYPLFLTAVQVLLYASIYVITPYDLGWSISASLSRLLLHVYPLPCWLIGWAIATEVSGTVSGQYEELICPKKSP